MKTLTVRLSAVSIAVTVFQKCTKGGLGRADGENRMVQPSRVDVFQFSSFQYIISATKITSSLFSSVEQLTQLFISPLCQIT